MNKLKLVICDIYLYFSYKLLFFLYNFELLQILVIGLKQTQIEDLKKIKKFLSKILENVENYFEKIYIVQCVKPAKKSYNTPNRPTSQLFRIFSLV